MFGESTATNQDRQAFLKRLSQGKLTRDENPETHFCVYFAGVDTGNKQVFLGHHKKSNLWLFNGGHIDQVETPEQAVLREIGEEWGVPLTLNDLSALRLLTVTNIVDSSKIICKVHYDIWFFAPLAVDAFRPDKKLLQTEFYENKWLTLKEARVKAVDPNTLLALDFIEDNLT